MTTSRSIPAETGQPVRIHHPSPVVRLPRRARKPRRSYDRIASTVSPRVAPDEAFAPVARAGEDDWFRDCYAGPAFAFSGAVFAPVVWRNADLKPSDLLAALGRRSGAEGDLGPVLALAGTPLCARGPTAHLRWSNDTERDLGHPVDASDGAVLFSDEETASAAVSRFFERDLVLTPTRVMLRTPPMAICWYGEAGFEALIQAGGNLDILKIPPVRPDLAAEACRIRASVDVAPLPEAIAIPIADRFPRSLLYDDDVALLANMMPERTLALLDHLLEGPCLHRSGKWDAIAAERDALVPTALRGRMGAVAPVAYADVLESCVATLRRAEDAMGMSMGTWHAACPNLPSLLRHVEELALPRILTASADLEALGALGPDGPRP